MKNKKKHQKNLYANERLLFVLTLKGGSQVDFFGKKDSKLIYDQ